MAHGRRGDRRSAAPPEYRRAAEGDRDVGRRGYRPAAGFFGPRVVEDQAARTPDAVAASTADAQLTYADLDARANRLAHRLRELGVGPDKVVALCGDRSLAALIGLLAVWKAGGAYLPLDPAYPAERLGGILEDSAPVVMLTTSGAGSTALAAALSGSSIKAPVLDLDMPAWMDRPSANLGRTGIGQTDKAPGAGSLAYLLYTSGSTGRPKGVMVEHASVVNLLRSVRTLIGIEAGDRMLALTTLSFDIAVVELWLPLTCGAETVLAEHAASLDPKLLATILARRQITHFQATPATWRMLIDFGWRGAASLTAICTGEALPAALASEIRERVGRLWNMYGPTETTVWSSAWPVPAELPGCGVVPIGRPLANQSIYLLDGFGEPVPIGVKGEIPHRRRGGCARLSRLAGADRGALPARSLRRLRRAARSRGGADVSNRRYRTATSRRDDRVSRPHRPSGEDPRLPHRARRDRGAARPHPAVRAAVVAVHENADGERQARRLLLVAEAGGSQPARSAARMARRRAPRLHGSSMPSCGSMPAADAKRQDRPQGPASAGHRARRPRGRYVAPRTPAEETLCRIWAEVLGLERVGMKTISSRLAAIRCWR